LQEPRFTRCSRAQHRLAKPGTRSLGSDVPCLPGAGKAGPGIDFTGCPFAVSCVLQPLCK